MHLNPFRLCSFNRKTFLSLVSLVFGIWVLFVLKTYHRFILMNKPHYKFAMSVKSAPENNQTTTLEKIENASEKYLIKMENCKIVELEAHHWAIIMRKKPRQKCSTPVFNILNKKLILLGNQTGKKVVKNCCIREVRRQESSKVSMNSDWMLNISESCVPIPVGGLWLNSSSFLKLECEEHQSNGGKINKFVDFASIVLSPEEHSEKTRAKVKYWKQKKKNKTTTELPPNILILGINSVSRLHTMRTLQKTRRMLLTNDFVELKGLTKIGKNGYSNMMGVFGGMREGEYSPCWPPKYAGPKSLDECPFIWKNFSEANYITGMAEDSPGLATFNYNKIGFKFQPVDYSIRTMMVAVQNHNKRSRVRKETSCLSGRNMFDSLFKYIQDFLEQVSGKAPFFLFSWFKTLEADFFHGIRNEDEHFENFLGKILMKDDKYLSNNTVIILLSSHGMEMGWNKYLKNSFQTYYEEALPFGFIRIPPSLKQSQPEWYKNLRDNSNKLTSMLDLHATISQILKLSKNYNDNKNENDNVHGQATPAKSQNGNMKNEQQSAFSLFEKIPDFRSCEDSKIPEEYCRCGSTPLLMNTSSLALKLGPVVTTKINSILNPVLRPKLCLSLVFRRVVYGRRVSQGSVQDKETQKNTGFVDYILGIEVESSSAQFQARVRDWAAAGDRAISSEVISEVTRVSSHSNESYCLKNPEQYKKFSPFCLCQEYDLYLRIQRFKSYMKWSSHFVP